MRRAGNIYYLPPGLVLRDPDQHPYVLLRDVDDDEEDAVVAYGSRRPTEANAGAPSVPIRPQRTGINANGLRDPTYFYPGILDQLTVDDLPRQRAGHVTPHLSALRQALSRTLGIGTGPAGSSRTPARSRRGHLVPWALPGATGWGIIVTAHAYSAAQSWQTLVPVVPVAEEQPASASVIVRRGEAWAHAVTPTATVAVLPTAVFAVWERREIAGPGPGVVPADLLTQVDAILVDYFSLPVASSP